MVIKLRIFLKLLSLYWEKLLDIIEKFLVLNPQELSKVYGETARECADRGWEKDAIYLYQKVILLNPRDKDAYFQLGRIYTRTKDWKEAMRFYHKSIELGLRNHEVYYRTGLAHDYFNQKEEALRCYKKAIKLD
ncbi:MAG: tetratricopeptide repeat protein, partial [Elusimicrobiota bacterium]|nr:tetratricopeptide repeat protein [Elusimicrobiota bacterium]